MKSNRRTGKKAALHATVYAALFLVFAAVDVLCVEAIWRGGFSQAIMWATRIVDVCFFTVLTTAALLGALYMLFGRLLPAACAVNLVLLGASLVQHYKLALRGEYFVLSDVLLVSEALSILEKFTLDFPWYVVLPGAVMAALPLLLWGIRIRGHWRSRAVCMALCAAVFAGGWHCALARTDMTTTELSSYYAKNGVLAGLVWSRPLPAQKPDNYTQESVLAALSPYRQEDDVQVKPDILFVMSESLYDLGKIEAFSVSEDTMPYTRELINGHWGGELYVISYGGGTSLTEYEVLTGYRAEKTSVAPYMDQTRVYDGMSSLATLLGEYGYYSVAMHPSIGETYNRDKVYLRMGFDETVFIEDMEPVDDRVGPFPSDKYFFEEIIRQYEERPKDKPWFSFVITFQNHGAYTYEYNRRDIAVSGVDGAYLNDASTFANAVRASDESLRELVAYFEKQERPVVIVLFGDHAPALSLIGYDPEDDADTHFKTHTTPLLVYSNYGFEMPQEMPRTLPAYRLGASVLSALGFRCDAYYNFLADPSVHGLMEARGMLLTQDGGVMDAAQYDEVNSRIELLFYDRVYGQMYGKAGETP